MNFVDLKKYMRPMLSQREREFLLRIVPVGQFIQLQSYSKAEVQEKLTCHGVFASVATAHCIFKSQWGTHPASQDKCNGSFANNLCLIESHKYWTRVVVNFEDKVYKGYKNWREFCIDFTDILAWNTGYEDVIAAGDIQEQVFLLSLRELDPIAYRSAVEELIESYGLKEFDWYAN